MESKKENESHTNIEIEKQIRITSGTSQGSSDGLSEDSKTDSLEIVANEASSIDMNQKSNVSNKIVIINGLEAIGSETSPNHTNQESDENIPSKKDSVIDLETIEKEAFLNDMNQKRNANISEKDDPIDGLETIDSGTSSDNMNQEINENIPPKDYSINGVELAQSTVPLNDMNQKNNANSSLKNELINDSAAAASNFSFEDSKSENDISEKEYSSIEIMESSDEIMFSFMDPEDKQTSSDTEKSSKLAVTDSKLNQMSSDVYFEEVNDITGSSTYLKIQFYKMKTILWNSKLAHIIIQSINGPCPLIAIANVLILRNEITLPNLMQYEIPADQLIEHVTKCLRRNIVNSNQKDLAINLKTAISFLPQFQLDLDVDIKFTGVQDFEYKSENIVFEILDIPLYHGWLIDPQTPEDIKLAVGNNSYNHLVSKIIDNINSAELQLSHEAYLADTFLSNTASQITYYGLWELSRHIKAEQIVIFFRKNEFITLLKHQNKLYQLVTDQSYHKERDMIWKTLENIEGAEEFVDSNFKSVTPKQDHSVFNISPQTAGSSNQTQLLDQDYLMAVRLQNEENMNDECFY